jgi:hypothetical protein
MKRLKAEFDSLQLPTTILIMVLIAIAGCRTTNYGRLASDPEVTRAFEAHQVLPEHTYYYRGTHSRPFVVAGIHKNFVLDSPIWVKIDPNSEDFRTLINRVSIQGSGGPRKPWGFKILDKSGRQIGVWYSSIRAAAVDVDENGRIVNLSPIRTATRGDQGM